jgi:hypothetical protein
MNAERPPLPKPSVYDQLYPSRFIKAGELMGKKVTLTIADVNMERLIGDDGKEKAKALISFRETEKQLVACKTNGLCIKSMFGKELAAWVGKRITLFEDTWNGEPCTRVWGSPDIAQDMTVEVSLPRRRPFKKVMHKMGGKNGTPPASDSQQQAESDAVSSGETSESGGL